MNISVNHIYHIYNEGNNKEPIFFENDNYLHFLKLYKKFVSPKAELLAYCLMPNHFNFLVYTTDQSVTPIQVGGLQLTNLSNSFRQLQSSYAKAINVQEQRVGSLFRQKLNSKQVDIEGADYATLAMHYIHQQPFKAGLVEKPEDWEFSSCRYFIKRKPNALCNVKMAVDLLDLDLSGFAAMSNQPFDKNYLDFIL